ncbi:hypothetical protein C8J56DRAFT_510813 [Mycena floridula]|nr:hypothetical protein C8J56DRAFT_510813 [Mycena floridula]
MVAAFAVNFASGLVQSKTETSILGRNQRPFSTELLSSTSVFAFGFHLRMDSHNSLEQGSNRRLPDDVCLSCSMKTALLVKQWFHFNLVSGGERPREREERERERDFRLSSLLHLHPVTLVALLGRRDIHTSTAKPPMSFLFHLRETCLSSKPLSQGRIAPFRRSADLCRPTILLSSRAF